MNQLITQTFNAPASSIFSGVDAGDDLSGGITGGYGLIRYRGKVWSIHFRQQEITLMRDDGDGPKGSIEVVILKANAQLSKTWYENGFDENNSAPPDCSSANGVVPDQGVPKKQSNTCINCPRNQWNTAANGGKGKACGDHRRLAVVPLTDIPNEHFGGPMLLRCPAASLQDLSAFDQKYKQQGYPYFAIGVKISFDHQESYPKFVFEAIRPLSDDEARLVIQHRASFEVARVISENTQTVSTPATEPPAGFLAAPTGAPVSQVVGAAVQPAAQPVAQQVQVQQPAQQPVAQPVVQPVAAQPQPQSAPVVQPVAQQPVQVAQPAAVAPATAGGFGRAATAPAAAVAQPAGKPAVTMTGFGAGAPVTPPGTAQQAIQPQAAQPQLPLTDPTAQAVVGAAFDASLDSKLEALLAG